MSKENGINASSSCLETATDVLVQSAGLKPGLPSGVSFEREANAIAHEASHLLHELGADAIQFDTKFDISELDAYPDIKRRYLLSLRGDGNCTRSNTCKR